MKSNLFFSILIFLLGALPLLSQDCGLSSLDDQQIAERFRQAENTEAVRKLAALAGPRAIPALKELASKNNEDRHFGTQAKRGMAEAALAKLGDDAALAQIEEELYESYNFGVTESAIDKLLFVRDERAISMLMTFLVRRSSDQKRIKNNGDYMTDPLAQVTQAISTMFPDTPKPAAWPYLRPEEANAWIKWWDEHKTSASPARASTVLEDSSLACLAKQIEWGSPEAVLTLAAEGRDRSIPALKILASVGDNSDSSRTALVRYNSSYQGRDAQFGTIRGNAQAALAKLGDQGELDVIVKELQSHRYDDALQKFTYLHNRSSMDAIRTRWAQLLHS